MRENAWWSTLNQCHGRRKDGKRCQQDAGPPFEVEGNGLYLYATCSVHRSQEQQIQVARGLGHIYDRVFHTR